MPTRAKRLCATPGCKRLTLVRRCETCSEKNKYRRVATAPRQQLAQASKMRGKRTYRNKRDMLIAMHPFCFNPIGTHVGRPPRARQVHHIEKITERPDLVDEPTNMVPLCVACHNEVEKVRKIDASAACWARWRAWCEEFLA